MLINQSFLLCLYRQVFTGHSVCGGPVRGLLRPHHREHLQEDGQREELWHIRPPFGRHCRPGRVLHFPLRSGHYLNFGVLAFCEKKIIDLPGGQLFGKLLFSFVLPANLLSPILEGLFEKTWRPLRVINFTSCIAFKTYKMLGTQSVASRLSRGHRRKQLTQTQWCVCRKHTFYNVP